MTMNFNQFMDNWPESRKDQFSYDALSAIFDYYEEYTEGTNEEVEFDPIAICCEWSEAENAIEAYKQYHAEGEEPDGETPEDKEAAAMEWLENNTTSLKLENGGVVYVQF